MLTQAIPRAVLSVLLAACTVREVPGDSTTTGTIPDPSTSTTTPTTTLPTNTTTTTATPTSGTPEPDTTTAQDSLDFVLKLDGPPEDGIECDGFKQLHPECPPGQKCTPDGDSAHTHCVAIVDDPKGLYEPCTLTGDGWSGHDDCDLGMLCWNFDNEGHGTCIGFLDCPDGLCSCVDPAATPSLCQECLFGYCLPPCDPFVQDCPNSGLCIPVNNGSNGFTCTPDASGDAGQVNDPCEFVNGCDPGLYCISADAASSACAKDSQTCCQPFCDLAFNVPCPNPDQQCLQWFDPRTPIPPGLENVGICAIPP